MMSILGGHASYFNARHGRKGHLFQNRFRSILVETDTYLKTLLKYIHLNPVKGGLIRRSELRDYPWTGHSALMRTHPRDWQDTRSVLRLFGETRNDAMRALEMYMMDTDEQIDADLMESGMLLTTGGMVVDREQPRFGKGQRLGRILGTRRFAEGLLAHPSMGRAPHTIVPISEDERFEALVAAISDCMRIDSGLLMAGWKQRRYARARSLVCFLALTRLGLTLANIAFRTNLSVSGVSQAVSRGKTLLRGTDDRDIMGLLKWLDANDMVLGHDMLVSKKRPNRNKASSNCGN